MRQWWKGSMTENGGVDDESVMDDILMTFRRTAKTQFTRLLGVGY